MSKTSTREKLETINLGMFGGHCFYIEKDGCFDTKVGMPGMQTGIYYQKP